jgi:acetylornithine deacetylase/succinyl-diaminopimelate desuccinylase-like protein
MSSDVDRRLRSLAERDDIAAAVSYAHEHDDATLAIQVELSEIPAPPFRESARARRIGEMLVDSGLQAALSDDEGNVVARRPGMSDEAPLVVSAHLDTVFPEGTDVRVRREGDLLRGPGISDDARGLATLVTLARMMEAASIRTRAPILFVATVGEEGIGDLRGVKRLFAADGRGQGAGGFISLDGAGLERIVVEGVGSRRYRIVVEGPGGHSWVDWGTANPIAALTALAHRLTTIALPEDPRTTLTLARIGGGTSINAIPQDAWLEIDTRCTDAEGLDTLEGSIRREVEALSRKRARLRFETHVIGNRPTGRTAAESPLVRAAVAATRAQHREPVLASSSTDANVPMGLGIPAVTMGCGGLAGQAHTTNEWYRNVGGVDGVVRAFHTVVLAAGLAPRG